MAKEAGDNEYATQCGEWIKAAREAMDKRLWDSRGYYLNYSEPDTNTKSDFVFGYQLDGEWITDHHGLAGGPVPGSRENGARYDQTLQRGRDQVRGRQLRQSRRHPGQGRGLRHATVTSRPRP